MMNKLPMMMRWLPVGLVLSASSYAFAASEDKGVTTNQSRALSLLPQPKSLGIVHNRIDSLATATHKTISNLARDEPSNDDPEYQFLLTVTINGTVLTQRPTPRNPNSPASSPSAAAIAIDSQSPTLKSTTASPTTRATTIPPSTESSASMSVAPTHHPMDESSSFPPTLDNTTADYDWAYENESSGGTLAPTTSLSSASSTEAPTNFPSAASSTSSPTNFPSATLSSEAPTTYLPTFAPTYVPSSLSTGAHISPSTTNTTTSASIPTAQQEAQDNDSCPREYDKTQTYVEGDLVSIKGNRRCRGNRCYLVFQCNMWPESAYCNLDVPGKRGSNKGGWLKLGRCTGNPVESGGDAQQEGELVESPTKAPSSNSSVASSSPSDASGTVHQDHQLSPSPTSSAKLVPTQQPTTKRQSVGSPIWSKPTDIAEQHTSNTNQQGPDGTTHADAIFVTLPRIICDITLSSTLSSKFERKNVLITAMTNMIFGLFEIHLPKSLYELAGISLNVDVKKNENNDSDTKLVRLHAYFTGSASFSLQGAPTSRELTTLLVRHFDVDEFNRLLKKAPIQARAANTRPESVKVNSVFFTLEDGSLILAGSTRYDENKLPSKAVAPGGEDGSRGIQIMFVVLALIAMACVLVLIMFLLYSNKRNEEEADGSFPVVHGSDLEEGLSMIAERNESSAEASKATNQDTGENPKPNDVAIEVEIPSTPRFAMSDLSETEDYNSDVSSLAESPLTVMANKSPPHLYYGRDCSSEGTQSTSGQARVGIAKPKGKGGDNTLGFVAEELQLKNWEIYDESSRMEC